VKWAGVKLSNQLLPATSERSKVKFKGIVLEIKEMMQVKNVGPSNAGKCLLAVKRPVEITFKCSRAIGRRIQDDKPRLPRCVPPQRIDYADRTTGKGR